MYYAEPRLVRALIESNLAQTQREMKKQALLRRAKIEQQGWWARRPRQLLNQLGHFLVGFGMRLQRLGSSQALPLKNDPVGGS